MRQFFCSLILFINLGSPCGLVFAQTRLHVQAMTAFVHTATAEALLQQIAEQQWKCPRIPSRWHVEQIAPTDQRPILFEARAFGALLLQRLLDWRSVLISPESSPEELLQRAETLTRLSDWTAATPGYGNLFLAARCDDLATIAIGRLLINLEMPLERILPLVAALDMPYKPPSFRREVLNHDAGTELFPLLSDLDQMNDFLDEIWTAGEAAYKYGFLGGEAAEFPSWEGLGVGPGISGDSDLL